MLGFNKRAQITDFPGFELQGAGFHVGTHHIQQFVLADAQGITHSTTPISATAAWFFSSACLAVNLK